MPKKIYLCAISGKKIPKERVEALKMLGTSENLWTCVEHSTTKPRQGVYLGEAGSSQILMVDKVFDDTVRTIFSKDSKVVQTEKDDDAAETGEEEPSDAPEGVYGSKELSYYTSTDEAGDPEESIQIVKRHEFA